MFLKLYPIIKENETKDYKGRQLYELLQNAHDCFTAECNDIDVKSS